MMCESARNILWYQNHKEVPKCEWMSAYSFYDVFPECCELTLGVAMFRKSFLSFPPSEHGHTRWRPPNPENNSKRKINNHPSSSGHLLMIRVSSAIPRGLAYHHRLFSSDSGLAISYFLTLNYNELFIGAQRRISFSLGPDHQQIFLSMIRPSTATFSSCGIQEWAHHRSLIQSWKIQFGLWLVGFWSECHPSNDASQWLNSLSSDFYTAEFEPL